MTHLAKEVHRTWKTWCKVHWKNDL